MEAHIDREIAGIRTHLAGLREKIDRMAFELDRALRKSDVLIEENLRLQKQLFDLRRKVK